MVSPAIWKYDGVYCQAEASDLLKPYVIVTKNDESVVPAAIRQGKDIRSCEEFCKARGYRYLVVTTDDQNSFENLRLRILLYSMPYSRWYPEFMRPDVQKWSKLLGYVQYAFHVSSHRQYGKSFHLDMDFLFVETIAHEKMLMEYPVAPFTEVSITGYPGVESFYLNRQKSHKKTIVYSPHHSISTNGATLHYATFEWLGDPILKLAKETGDIIDWVFKPHPRLRDRLVDHPDWGEDKVNEYYRAWGSVEEGNYEDLFRKADAIINDSGSFLAEFLATGKPSLFLLNEGFSGVNRNSFGERCLEFCYIATVFEQVEAFVKDVVLNGEDVMERDRLQFVRSEEFYPCESPSKEIVSILEKV